MIEIHGWYVDSMGLRNIGFTLVELLVVVAIIAILAAIAVPNFLEAQVRAKVSRARADMRNAATALESYAIDQNHYPPMLGPDDGTGQTRNSRNAYGSLRLNPWRGIPHQTTTPVAYLTAIPLDVFKSAAVATPSDDNATPDVGKAFVDGNPFDSSFVYHNVLQFAEAAPGGPFAAGLGRLGAWRLSSLGPDLRFNAIEALEPGVSGYYDPTNGTISSGEIVRSQKAPEGVTDAR